MRKPCDCFLKGLLLLDLPDFLVGEELPLPAPTLTPRPPYLLLLVRRLNTCGQAPC